MIQKMRLKEKTICFTGHRDMKAPEWIKVKLTEIIEKYIQNGYDTFLAGGARGFDNLAADVVIELKEKYPDIKLMVVLPFPNHYKHEKNWSATEVKEYKSVLKRADETITLLKEYKSGSYFKRNRYLVDNSSLCIAYYRRSGSGTAYTVNYAELSKIQVINLAKDEKRTQDN